MSTPLTQQGLNALLANLDCDRERAGERYQQIRCRLVRLFEFRGCELAKDLADETIFRVARLAAEGLVLPSNPHGFFYGVAHRVYKEMLRQLGRGDNVLSFQEWLATIPAVEEPNPVSPAPVSTQPTYRKAHLLERLCRHLQVLVPVFYAQVLEPTLADLWLEHSAALAEGLPLKARWILLQGCLALAADAIYQLGYSALGRIAAFWQAKSPK